jgi:hypothetical protein
MALSAVQLGFNYVWAQTDTSPNTTIGGASPEFNFAPGVNLTLAAGAVGAPTATTLNFTFSNGPATLAQIFNSSSFNGTIITVSYQGTDCQLTLNNPTPTGPTPTNTHTPVADCTTGLVRASVVQYEPAGTIARFSVTNYRNVLAQMVGILVNWSPGGGTTPPITGMQLHEIYGSPDTLANPARTLMWQAGAGQDSTPPTFGRSGNAAPAESTWLNNLNIPAGATYNIYIVFRGIGGGSLNDWVLNRSVFNGTQFFFNVPNCPTINQFTQVPGGPGGPGGEVTTVETVQPPTATHTSAPPTATRTPAPATMTVTRSLTPTTGPTSTATHTPNTPPTATRTSTATNVPNTSTPTRTATPNVPNTPTPTPTDPEGIIGE